jgi:hypothetical protein
MTRSLISGERLAAKSHRAPMRKRVAGTRRDTDLYGLVVDHDRKVIEIRRATRGTALSHGLAIATLKSP